MDANHPNCFAPNARIKAPYEPKIRNVAGYWNFDSLMTLRPDPFEAVHHGGLGHAKRQPSRDLAL